MNAQAQLTNLETPILLNHCQRRELSAFEEFVNRFQKPVFSIIYRFCRDIAMTEEFSTQVFLTAWERLARANLQNSVSPFPWLMSIVFEQLQVWEHSAAKDIPADGNRVESIGHRLDQLRLEDRYVLLLRLTLSFSYDEIAEAMSWTRPMVKASLHWSRCELKNCLLPKIGSVKAI